MQDYLYESFDYNSEDFISVSDEFSLWSAPFGLKLLDKLPIRKNLTLLDVGPGTGFPLLEIAQRLGHSSTVFGIDPWTLALKRIEQKIKIIGLKNTILVEGTIEKTPFQNNYFDVLVSNNGLNNVEDINIAFSECFRILKPGGKLLFTFNLPDTMIEFYSVFENVLRDENLFEEIDFLKKHIFLKRKPTEFIIDLLHKNLFVVNEAVTDSFKYRFTDGTSFFNYYFIKYAFLEPWKNLVKQEDLENVFKKIERSLNERAEELGELSLTIPFAFIDCEKPAEK